MAFGNGGDFLHQLQQQIGAAHAKVEQAARKMGQVEGQNALLRQQMGLLDQQMNQLAGILDQTSGGRSGSGAGPDRIDVGQVPWGDAVMYINQIPGRRVPYDLMVSIPLGATVTSQQQQSAVVSQDGPFVGVARYAAFQSNHTFVVTDEGVTATFNGRSYGRWRPIHSVMDYNDGLALQPVVGVANPGTGGPIYASPSNYSAFRTMEFDGTIEFYDEGSGYGRQNRAVPSCFYTDAQNSAFQLAALDFFERGDTLQWKVTPGHLNNPQGGNVSAFMAGGIFPSIASQFDVQEGILDEFDEELSSDPVRRIPDGIFIVGMHGFKILQPPGPVRLV